MASASVPLPIDHVQPAHRAGVGRTLTHGQHRRGALLSLAGIAAAGAGAATAQAAEPDPVLALIERAEALRRQADSLNSVGDERGSDQLLDASWAVADEATATTPTTMEGLVAQLRILGDRLSEGTRGQQDAADAFAIMRHASALSTRAAA